MTDWDYLKFGQFLQVWQVFDTLTEIGGGKRGSVKNIWI